MVQITQEIGVESIAQQLRLAILAGDIQPGDRLVQEKLAKAFHVSRIPLREALRLLEAEGLVRNAPNRGMVVVVLDRQAIQELYALRRAIEPGLAPGIVAGCGPRDIERLQRQVEAMAALGPAPVERGKLNYAFHQGMYEIAERPLTLRIVKQLLHLSEPISKRWVGSADRVGRIDAEHRQMVQAIASKDARVLADTIQRHIEGARDHALSLMSDTGSAQGF